MLKKTIAGVCLALAGAILMGANKGNAEECTVWDSILQFYREDENTDQLIFVKYTGGCRAEVELYAKDGLGDGWTQILSCEGLVGERGIEKEKEGDLKTPVGIYGAVTAFGIKKNPGTRLPYLDVTENIYCCDEDCEYYNQIIDISRCGHDCKGEHMIKCQPEYDYGIFLDYNREGISGRGSAIFLHCIGAKAYTSGCIAVEESDMKTILRNCDKGVKICIFDKTQKY